MGYKLVMTKLATEDMERIAAYIEHDLSNPEASKHFLDEVSRCLDRMEANPFTAAKCLDPYLARKEYRTEHAGSYLMVFMADKAAKQATILRIFHPLQNYKKYL